MPHVSCKPTYLRDLAVSLRVIERDVIKLETFLIKEPVMIEFIAGDVVA